MEHAQPNLAPRTARFWVACGIMAVGTLATAIVTRQASVNAAAIPAAALITALSVLSVTALMAPLTPYPRWSHWVGAAVLAAWALASPLLVSDTQAWRKDIQPLLWFMPWFVLTGATMPRRLRGACATVGVRAGWFMVVASGVLGGILILTEWIGRML
jgi:hypothetical protein